MNSENVVAVRNLKDRTIELTMADPLTGEGSTRRFLAIRGGLSWPTVRAPAYFCIIGKEYVRVPYFGDAEEAQAGKMVLLAEYASESLSLDGFYAKMVDAATQMSCCEFYTDLPEERFSCGYQSDFDRYTMKRKARVNVIRASDADNFQLGISRIKSAIGNVSLLIPDDSLIYSELQTITRQDLAEAPQDRFHAINGFRHVVGSFFRWPTIYLPQGSSMMQNTLQQRLKSGTSFMAS